MKVNKLIEKLEKLNPDMQIGLVYQDGNGHWFHHSLEFDEILIDSDGKLCNYKSELLLTTVLRIS